MAGEQDIAEGSIAIGTMPSPMRNGSRDLILKWQAVRRPVRVCEGGGWYSAHPTETAWCFRSWMEHKLAPGWAWPKMAEEGDGDLEALVERAFYSALIRYGFAPAKPLCKAAGQ
jgi:hypothetical protein